MPTGGAVDRTAARVHITTHRTATAALSPGDGDDSIRIESILRSAE